MSRTDDLWQLAEVETDECTLWPYALTSRGYPNLVNRTGHKMVCERYHGPQPEGLEVAHSCNVKRCVNPRHLRWATHVENLADTYGYGPRLSHRLGTGHPKRPGGRLRSLTLEQVTEIRARHAQGEGVTALGTEFGVTHSAISKIVWNKTRRKA